MCHWDHHEGEKLIMKSCLEMNGYDCIIMTKFTSRVPLRHLAPLKLGYS